jgi:hypothetical protein
MLSPLTSADMPQPMHADLAHYPGIASLHRPKWILLRTSFQKLGLSKLFMLSQATSSAALSTHSLPSALLSSIDAHN